MVWGNREVISDDKGRFVIYFFYNIKQLWFLVNRYMYRGVRMNDLLIEKSIQYINGIFEL